MDAIDVGVQGISAEVEALVRIGDSLARIAEVLETILEAAAAHDAEAAADTDSLRGMWTPVGGPFVDADGRVIVLPEGYALCRLVEPGTGAGE